MERRGNNLWVDSVELGWRIYGQRIIYYVQP
jgi:hypothetical protein